ncbi:trypsin-like peptidase domain-containing protein [Xanthobacter autotrophicus]|uniref:trypsin-like peptidase domain-containing protein n=1 Tax=Xanthobacter autotrophicus TaxID=280 RepID=UPI00372B8BF2
MSPNLKSTDVPFVSLPDTKADPFSDVGSTAGVDNPAKMLEGWTGWARRGRALQPDASKADIDFEASIGRFQTSPAALLQILAERRRAVAILSVEGRNHEGLEGSWSGTGFLVSRNILLTNHHVLNTPDVAVSARVEFNYEISPDALLNGDGRTLPASQVFKLDPARFFITSPTADGLDYTFVRIDEAASQAFGTIPLERSSFTVNKSDQAFVIHHPDGQHKQVSFDDSDVVGMDTTVIHYTSDTLGGSSGAPVFDRRGRLIALHHASRRWSGETEDGKPIDRINEGIKIAAIALDLETRARKGGADAAYAEAILKEIKGSDTMAGFFGGYGRRIDSERTAPEAVVDTYRGTDQDIDVGFWNIEWLANRWKQPGKLDGVAKVITDLNLDVWGLSEISPPSVEALVQRIYEVYGEKFDFALSEPDAGTSKQSTAMIWKSSSLKGEKVAWPSSVEPLFHQRSDDPDVRVEAVHGNIFDRYPALYRFSCAAAHAPYSFFAVPLHLKAMDEGSLRRRLATRILARAVEDVVAEHNLDVILGGDMNAPLARGDFSAIEDAGFLILGATDETEGAFSYIKSPRSAIDNIFLSPNMRQTVGKVDYFIVAKDRTMSNYLAISDHRPVAVRLSLASTGGQQPLDRKQIDAMIDQMLDAPAPPQAKRSKAPVAPNNLTGPARKAPSAKAAKPEKEAPTPPGKTPPRRTSRRGK